MDRLTQNFVCFVKTTTGTRKRYDNSLNFVILLHTLISLGGQITSSVFEHPNQSSPIAKSNQNNAKFHGPIKCIHLRMHKANTKVFPNYG